MIRWSYLGPRLLGVGMLLLVAWLMLNPVLRHALIFTGQSTLSAKVEIGSLRTSLCRGKIQLGSIAIANPSSPLKNLLEAEQIVVDLNTSALLQQKLVVREGRLSGLRIGSPRDTSGSLDQRPAWAMDLNADAFLEAGSRWLEGLSGILKEELTEEVEGLESVRLARNLTERWPAEYKKLLDRIDSLKARTDELRNLVQSPPESAVKAFETYQDAVQRLNTVREEMTAIRTEVDRLGYQAFRDKEAIGQARKQDAEHLKQRLQLARLEPEAVSHYLLGPEAGKQLLTVVDWVRWIGEQLPEGGQATEGLPESNRRGVDVCFPGLRQYPDFLIETLAIDGHVPLGGEWIAINGTVTDLTSQPVLHGRPTLMRFRATGDTLFQADAVFDRTGQTPHDHVVVNCPALILPERILGDADHLAVRVAPGPIHLWMELDIKGDVVSGRLLAKQEQVSLTPMVAASYGGTRIAERLKHVTDEVQAIELAASFSGTGKDLDWRIQSNLGPRLVDGFNQMASEELESRRRELAAVAARRINEELARFDAMIDARQRELFARLDGDRAEVLQLAQTVSEGMPGVQNTLRQAVPPETSNEIRAAIQNAWRR